MEPINLLFYPTFYRTLERFIIKLYTLLLREYVSLLIFWVSFYMKYLLFRNILVNNYQTSPKRCLIIPVKNSGSLNKHLQFNFLFISLRSYRLSRFIFQSFCFGYSEKGYLKIISMFWNQNSLMTQNIMSFKSLFKFLVKF